MDRVDARVDGLAESWQDGGMMHVEAGISAVLDAQRGTKAVGGGRLVGRIKKENRGETLTVLWYLPGSWGTEAWNEIMIRLNN